MSVMIFRRENNSAEEWLRVNDDGSVTHHIENSGWPMMESGILAREKQLTAEAAKVRWPMYVEKIDVALSEKAKISPNSDATRNLQSENSTKC